MISLNEDMKRFKRLDRIKLCRLCKQPKAKCPYTGAFNTKELDHQACEKYAGW